MMPSDNTNKEGSTPAPAPAPARREPPPPSLEATPSQRNAMEEFIASPENPDRWRDLVQSMGRRGRHRQNDDADDDNGSRARPREVGNTDGDQDQLSGQMNITADESVVDAPRAQTGLELVGEDNHDLPIPAGMTEALLDTAEADGSITNQDGHVEQITDGDGPSASSAVALAASLEATDRAAKQQIKHQLESVVDAPRAQTGLELIGEDNRCLPVPIGIIEAELDAAEAGDGSIIKQAGRIEQITDGDGPSASSAVALAASLEATDEAAKQQIKHQLETLDAAEAGDGSIIKQTGQLEQITDRDGPSASSAVALAASLEATTDRAAKQQIKHQLETVNDNQRPVPFDSSQFEGSAGKMAKKLLATPSHTGDGGESIVYPTRAEIEDEVELGYINTLGGDEESPPVDNEDGIEGYSNPDAGGNDPSQIMDATANIRQSTDQGLPSIHAYRVEEGDVVIATPTLPWWKQKRVRLFLGTVILVLAAMAIALGVAFSSRTDSDTTNATVVATVDRSNAPSVSAIPSSSPTPCGDIIVSERQTIDLGLSNTQDLTMTVDGSNMVLAVKDGGDSSISHIMFYSLGNDDKWSKRSQFEQDYDNYSYVAISGKSAVVGLPYWGDNQEGMVLVYEQDEFGFWKEIEDPFTLDTNSTSLFRFGSHVDISGDLACVGDSDNLYLFHRDGDIKWIQFDMIANAYECSIDGDTIVTFDGAFKRIDENWNRHIQLYTYINGGIIPLQDPIEILDGDWVYSFHLNGNNLVIATRIDHITIYHRDEVNGTFSFLQQLNISNSRYGDVSIDKDLLVVGGDDGRTHIFSEQNGYWVETLVLDETYGSYTLSDRNLLAWVFTWDGATELHYYNLDRCTQAWPTQAPSLSLMPSSPPSKTPSVSSPPSLSPSASTSPTETCDWIEVTVVYDKYPTDTSWELYNIGLGGNEVEVKSYSEANTDATSHAETVCLTEGDYEFVILDSYGDGGGRYSVTLEGALIAEGGEFESEEATSFSIPFVPAPSISPSTSISPTISSPPTVSPSLSMLPSVSTSPTDTCYWVTVTVVYDDYPTETSWTLYNIGLVGTDVEVKSYSEKNGDATSYTETVCLTKGEYEFVIYGICCRLFSGHYNVTTLDGQLIAEGGEFWFYVSEATRFSIPFVPTP